MNRVFCRLSRAFALLSALFVLSALPLSAQTAREAETMTEVMEAVRADEWDRAFALAGRKGSVMSDIVMWRYLRAGQGTFAETEAFLTRRPDWPGLGLLRQRQERAITAETDPDRVLAYFAAEPPQTGAGVLRMADALIARGRAEEAEAQAVLAWFSMPLDSAEEAAFLARYEKALKPYHWQRLDMLLWAGETVPAERMIPRVDEAHQKLAAARIGLRKRAKGVDGLIAAVPQALQDDPGLAFERFYWRARKGRADDAIELILERSTGVAGLGIPEHWSNYRRQFARRLMRDGHAKRAYDMAANHHLDGGADRNDLEWLAGFIALRKLNDPARALEHFQRFRAGVDTPISLGRAGYWEGRAQEALGNAEAAQAAYAFGAEFQTSFYGQLAAERAGLPMDAKLTGTEDFGDWRKSAFWSSSVMEAVRLFEAADDIFMAERFATHLSESLSREEIGQLGAWAESVGDAYLQVKIAKRAAYRGIVVERAYFPLPALELDHDAVPHELALAIARRESEFRPDVVSHAGARGYMQLMPGTAQQMAGRLKVSYSKNQLTTDPAYNVKLGTEYLALLREEFGANPVLVSAGYNAGPHRSRTWSARFGDPRARSIDVVDWIEHIPFRETRNYVMRVSESLAVYRARLSGKLEVPSLSKELKAR